MEWEKLHADSCAIAMPDEMKHRIIRNCKIQAANSRKDNIIKYSHHSFFRKHAAVITVLMICICLSVTVLAASDSLNGFFRDITNFRGAVIGTAYERATAEISIVATANSDTLSVCASFNDPKRFPYRDAEMLGIGEYRIIDVNGIIVKEGSSDAAEIVDGQAVITICLDGLTHDNYTLIVTSFVTDKKGDQPLTISGNWEYPFMK